MKTLSIFVLITITYCITLNAKAESVLIRNVAIVSPEALGSHKIQNVFIENGYIKALTKEPVDADTVIEGEGKFLIPGLIDSHVHLDGIPSMLPRHMKKQPIIAKQTIVQIPRSYLYFGFTTVVDLLASKQAIDKWNEQTLRPDAHFCIGAPIANGYPLAWLPEEKRFNADGAQYILYDERQKESIPEFIDPLLHTPQAVVKKIKEAGARCVKSFYESGFGRLRNLPNPTLDMMRSLVGSAHKEGMPVFLHGNSQAAQEFAVDAGVDIIAHGMWHWRDKKAQKPTDNVTALINRIANKRIGYQPTIQVIYGEQELFNDAFFDNPNVQHSMPAGLVNWYKSDDGRWMRRNMAKNMGKKGKDIGYEGIKKRYTLPIQRLKNVVNLLASNDAQLIFGSDTPSGPFYTQFHGLNGRLEMQHWLDAGVTLERLFRALTIDNAHALGLDNQLGTVEKGKTANLLLLEANPLKSITAYDAIDVVILHGKVIDRALLSAKALK